MRATLTGQMLDTLVGFPSARLLAYPIVSTEGANLFYLADSTLHIYQPDINTGILDDPDMPAVPANVVTIIAHPNPFNSAVTFTWTSDLPGSTLTIHNILGQTVQTFDASVLTGNSTHTWDGSDSRGRPVASGVYFARLANGHQVATTKLVLLR